MSKRTNSGGVTKGSWTESEDDVLRSQVKMRGDDELCNGWAEIAEHIPGRSAKQCRERWVQNLKPSLDRGPLTTQECEFITTQVRLIGPKWAEIARQLRANGISTRSDNAVKNWFNGNKNRMKRAQRRGREANDPDQMHAPLMQSHHSHTSSLGRRSSFQPLPEISTWSTPYSPLPSPSTPYQHHSHSRSHSQSHSYAHSRPSSQHSNGFGFRGFPVFPGNYPLLSPRQQLPHLSGSPRQMQLPLPLPSLATLSGSRHYFDERRIFDERRPIDERRLTEERRSSLFGSAESPASMPPLESDMGSPMLAAQQQSPAMSMYTNPPTEYGLSGIGAGYQYQERPLMMSRTPSQQSNHSYIELMEPSCAPAPPPGSERLGISNIFY